MKIDVKQVIVSTSHGRPADKYIQSLYTSMDGAVSSRKLPSTTALRKKPGQSSRRKVGVQLRKTQRAALLMAGATSVLYEGCA